MRKHLAQFVAIIILLITLSNPAYSGTDYQKVGDANGIDIYLDKNSIVYYDDFIIVTGKEVAKEGWLSGLDQTLASECYFKYALDKTTHSCKLLELFAVAEGCEITKQLTETQWLEENWEYEAKDFHERYDYRRKYSYDDTPWSNFGSNDEVMTIIYEGGMSLAGIKTNHELKDSGTNNESAGASGEKAASANLLMVILAAAVGVLGTVIFIQHKNKR